MDTRGYYGFKFHPARRTRGGPSRTLKLYVPASLRIVPPGPDNRGGGGLLRSSRQAVQSVEEEPLHRMAFMEQGRPRFWNRVAEFGHAETIAGGP